MHLGLHRQKQRRLIDDDAYNTNCALSMMEASPDICCSFLHAGPAHSSWRCTAVLLYATFLYQTQPLCVVYIPFEGCDVICGRLEIT